MQEKQTIEEIELHWRKIVYSIHNFGNDKHHSNCDNEVRCDNLGSVARSNNITLQHDSTTLSKDYYGIN